MNPVGVKEYLEVYLQIPAQRRNLPSDPLEFWRIVARDISCPPALIPVVKSLLCIMAASTCVERQFKLRQRILTDNRAAMSRTTEMLLHLILSNQTCFERFRNFEVFSRSINMGIVGSRNYADTLFASEAVLRDIYTFDRVFQALNLLPASPSAH